jgi:hypothetical protein
MQITYFPERDFTGRIDAGNRGRQIP